MSRRIPLNIRFRPQPVATAEIDRSHAAAEELLAEPVDWVRRLHCARVDVDLDAPHDAEHPELAAAGFRPLCTAWVRHPGVGQRVERRVDVWVDPTTAVRAEVIGRRIYLSSLYDDGSSLVCVPDAGVESWLCSSSCEVLQTAGDVHTDLGAIQQRGEQLRRDGRRALLCADGRAYQQHLRLGVLRHSKAPERSILIGDNRLLFPMTLWLAAELVAWRDQRADRHGLENSINPR